MPTGAPVICVDIGWKVIGWGAACSDQWPSLDTRSPPSRSSLAQRAGLEVGVTAVMSFPELMLRVLRREVIVVAVVSSTLR